MVTPATGLAADILAQRHCSRHGPSAESAVPMPFGSILFPDAEPDPDLGTRAVPASFRDLNLDQVVDSVTLGRCRPVSAPTSTAACSAA